MKNVILHSLRLLNFKGVRDLNITFDGNMNVYGANEAGKSTIYTAFTWLLTGKDEFDRKDYEIKNTKKKELNSQAHEVEAVIYTTEDGLEFEHKLKRVYLEKWTKPKGQSTKVFEGHKTDYYYNDVPCNASEFQVKVDAIIEGKIIKLVTNPTYFNSLNWQEQRRGLIGIAGDITDNDIFDVIATVENNYSSLRKVLIGGKSLDEYKKELAAKKLLLKKASVEFQPRIDELKRGKPELKNWHNLQQQIGDKQAEINNIDIILSDASRALSGKQKQLISKQKELHGKQTLLANIRFKIKSDVEVKKNSGASDIKKLQQEIESVHRIILTLQKEDTDRENNLIAYQKQIADKNKIIEQLRSDWSTINAERFQFDESKCECPTCKQSLPADQIESKKTELLKNFNESVSQRKKSKVDYSNQVKAEIAQFQQKIADLQKANNSEAIAAEQNRIPSINNKLSILQISEKSKKVDDIETAVDALMALNADALNIKEEIDQIETDIKFETEAMGQENDNGADLIKKQKLQSEIDDLKKELSDKAIIEKTNARISELENEEQANAQAIADLEQKEFEVETYTRAKMDILERRVNSMFKFVKFRLFEIQVNGGIAETCVCEYNNVPCPTLNTAAKLLAGIDVLNTLSEFYEIHAPVFCDNRESVTFIPESKSQIISLYVSEPDKILRIEKASNKLPSIKKSATLFAETA